jgi:hypothetical protein
MTTDTAEARSRMLPRSGVEDVVREVMASRQYLGKEPYMVRVDGRWVHRDLPPDQGLRLEHFLAEIQALPDPVRAWDAAKAVTKVLHERGHHWLLGELEQAWDKRWPDPEQDAPEPDAGQQWMPLCGYCGQPCSDPRARYCSRSHRQQAYKRRKRQQQG